MANSRAKQKYNLFWLSLLLLAIVVEASYILKLEREKIAAESSPVQQVSGVNTSR